MMKKLIFVLLMCCVFMAPYVAPAAADSAQAICVPWMASSPGVAHYTYSGAEITLKGIARNGATEYKWDFGDGTSTDWTGISDPYNLGVKHTYTGFVGELFSATLSVRDGAGTTSQDGYLVKIYEGSDLSNPEQLDVRTYMAIDEGLWHLHTTMIRGTYAAGSPGYEQPYGYWGNQDYPLAALGTAVDSFQLHGRRVNGDYDGDPYVETVQLALNYLLANTYAFSIGAQSAGNPDTNDNGIGLVANQSGSATDIRQTYIGGIAMIALATSDAANRTAAVGREHVYGRAYKDIVQDMVDFFAWGQVDSGTGRGGWRYYANYTDSDMSTTQWPPLGMLAAEQNMGSTVPPFVRSELVYFLNHAQYDAKDNDNGGFAYGDALNRLFLNNTKAAAGIIGHEFLGTALTDPKVQSAIGFLYRHWNDSGTGWDDTQLHGNSYGMYSVMKAFRFPEPDITAVTEYDYNAGTQTANSFDWFYTPPGQTQEGLASYTVRTQHADGGWDDTVGNNAVYGAFSTGWHLLVLLRGVTIIPPQAVICFCEKQDYNWLQEFTLDGSCSTHPDITRHIVSYEWDFDYTGEFATDVTGTTATKIGGYIRPPIDELPADEVVIHPAALRVTDDNPGNLGGPQQHIFECNVTVHDPPHCPHAYAGGPYIGWFNEPVTLDASASEDPDNEIATYEWDLDNDGLYGADDNDCFGQPSDAVGKNPTWTWSAPFKGIISLKVTDFATGIFPSCSDYVDTSVEIGNHDPIAEPGGPYAALPDSTILLDGTGSSDPDLDRGDTLSFAWDLDRDGAYNDSVDAKPSFAAGPISTTHDVCLKVTDSFEQYNIACAAITVIGLSLSNASVPEHTDTTAGYSVGELITTHPNSGDTFTYSIVGGADAGFFSIGGAGSNELILTNGVLDFEAKPSYAVSIRTTDSGGLYVELPFTISVIDLNDAPSGTDTTVTTLENTDYTFGTADFGFSDIVENHAFQAVHSTTVPGAGTLTNNTVLVNAGDIISTVDIAAGNLVFTPASNESGIEYTSFTFQVQDAGGTANGGVDLDPIPNTMTITVFNTPTCTSPTECPDGVEVTPIPDVAVTFPAVTAAGQTTADKADALPTGCPGSENFKFETLKTCYDVSTTAEYDPPVELCFTLPGEDVTELTIGHDDSVQGWVELTADCDMTITTDCLIRYPATETICARVDSLSWFVVVRDTTAPTFTLDTLKDRLWPPNHRMVHVATVRDVADHVDPSPTVDIQVTSSDPENGKGDGNTASDWEIRKVNDTWEVWVRAERSGKGDRVYAITATATDVSGNQATATHAVTVPHDKRKK